MNSHMAVSQSNSSRKLTIVALCSLSVLCVLAAGWWRFSIMAKRVDIVEANGETEMDIGKLSSVSLYDVSRKTTVELKASANGPKRLLVFLTAADCSSCLDELGDWLSIAKTTPSERFEVDLIYIHTASNELASFMQSNPLPYHTYFDEQGELSKQMNIPPQTPVTVLVDKNFKVLAAQAPAPDANARQPFIARVEAIVARGE